MSIVDTFHLIKGASLATGLVRMKNFVIRQESGHVTVSSLLRLSSKFTLEGNDKYF